MKFNFWIFYILMFFIISCVQNSNNNNFEFNWGNVPTDIKDSLTYMSNRHIPNSIAGATAQEPRDYSKLVWILKNAKTEDLVRLFYEHPNGQIKGIAAKGLIRRNSEKLFEHFKYAIEQNENVRYYDWCQKLGGYFYRELTHGVPINLELYFTKSQIDEINILMSEKTFECEMRKTTGYNKR